MSQTIDIAPVRKSIRVAAAQAHAFDVFTAGIGTWWPKRAGIGGKEARHSAIEPRLGGYWYQESPEGARTNVGAIKCWEPPLRFIVSWDANCHWQSDTSVSSEVEVRFIADGPDATIVELEHRNFEALGAEGGASMRRDVDGGWPGMLDSFRQAAEAAAAHHGH
jgi:uncharacterized protein YndB with AHSA1/START domain